ncbi:5-(carboxyamino)imidazole ribonucleotide synthase [Haloquadratum walsbyi]|uniref:N5-carboxyaminoimidazole ribonucleotide synthase n=1 Tax=Haloquadratum walsbyi J07HQW2 TaxID=1238425 RepID=U1NIC3_9EURY|nr:5-(carboxyamino)imidazole ribonucleotide synthase [Haloquadratum walsbyi]ERG96658.1 MAG: phosphoribosylaminoimidazole carboxylase, PurK protein [Haloquadratum walsbyi J07HQW2]
MSVTLPGPTLGVVGGGQLGRMLAEAAAPLGVEVIVLDPTPDCPAAPVVRDQIVGEFDDPDAVSELAGRVDAITFEIELADADLLSDVTSTFDVTVNPAPSTLAMIEDKLIQKRTLDNAGIPVPSFRAVDTVSELKTALDIFDAVMLKARTGGYDGRGNVPVTDPANAADALASVGGSAMAERLIDFTRELSVIAVKGTETTRTFPPGENIHEAEILRETIIPARTSEDARDRADAVARDVLETLDGRGVFGIEMFETADGNILVNEIAPRPHNSGHWTIEGAHSSQFEQHVRAVLGWPLGSTTRRSPTVMTNILGTVDTPCPAMLTGIESVLADEHTSMHWYGKDEVRPLRKMGHLTLTDDTAEAHDSSAEPDPSSIQSLIERARRCREAVAFIETPLE